MADDFDLNSYVQTKNQAPTSLPQDSSNFDLDNYLNQKQYGTPGQQAIAGLEGAAQGVIGPLAPAIERATGLTTPEAIRGRAEANPTTHTLAKAAGFAGSLFVPGLSEYGLAAQAGNVGEHAAALLPEAASTILQTGIKGGAELGALATSDELTKMVTQDPNQTLGSAAINIGLSGVLGGVGGAALGAVSPAWDKAKNIISSNKLLSDFMIETKALQDAKSGLINDFEAIPSSEQSSSMGAKLARWVNDKGAEALAKSTGEVISSGLGGSLGAIVGHPLFGAIAGERTLAPIISSVAKPFIENGLDSLAAKATADYVGAAIKGQSLLDSSVASLFGKGSEVVAKDLIPDQASRDKLQKSLDFVSATPDNALSIGGNIGHYLPDHATAAATAGASAINYLNQLKPKQPVQAPLDTPAPVDRHEQQKYNRALDIAQQPLLVLQHIKNASLQPQDVQTLNTIYPALHDSMVQKITNNLASNNVRLPYSQRVSLNLLMGGTAFDSTMTPGSMQTIIGSASPQSLAQAEQTKQGGGAKRASGTTLNQLNKVNQLGFTPLQARQAEKRS